MHSAPQGNPRAASRIRNPNQEQGGTAATTYLCETMNKTTRRMYRRLLPAAMLCAAACFSPVQALAQQQKPFVVPELQQWTAAEGVFTPSARARVTYTGVAEAKMVP